MEWPAAFLLGLFGGLHCAGMCGPLALALPATRGGRLRFAFGRLAYNTGRILTYTLVGAVVGLVGKTVVLVGVQRWVSIGLGVGLLGGWLMSQRLAPAAAVAALVGRLKRAMSALLRGRSIAALGLLGMLNGLLPCGLVYVAAAGAATTSGPLAGAAFMVAFGLGTLPTMLGISLTGRLVPVALRTKFQRAVPVVVVLVAGLLILRGLALGIPYLSPEVVGGAPCCHR
jgi:sulfite exporter TauE/SafE